MPLIGGLLEEKRNDFHQPTHQQNQKDENDHQEIVGLNHLVRDAGFRVVCHDVIFLKRAQQQRGC